MINKKNIVFLFVGLVLGIAITLIIPFFITSNLTIGSNSIVYLSNGQVVTDVKTTNFKKIKINKVIKQDRDEFIDFLIGLDNFDLKFSELEKLSKAYVVILNKKHKAEIVETVRYNDNMRGLVKIK